MALSRSWDEHMVERLQAHPEEIPGYLDACLEEGPGTFLGGLRQAIEAAGGMTGAAAKARLHRVSLYKMLGDKGNPTLSSLTQVLEALSLRLSVVPLASSERQVRGRRSKARQSSVR